MAAKSAARRLEVGGWVVGTCEGDRFTLLELAATVPPPIVNPPPITRQILTGCQKMPPNLSFSDPYFSSRCQEPMWEMSIDT